MTPPQVFASWTPQEAWLGCELARRSLRARIDGAPLRPAAPADEPSAAGPFHVAFVPDEREACLKLHLDGHRAVLLLDTEALRGGRWRSDWLLELTRSHHERWLLAPGETLALDDLGGSCLLTARLLRKKRYLLPDGRGSSLRIRLDDRSFFQRTRQSSALLDHEGESQTTWARPTLREDAPFWQIDLGESYFFPEITIDLAGVEAGSSLQLRGFTLPDPGGEPPPGAPAMALDLDRHAPDLQGLTRVSFQVDWVARFLRVELRCSRGPVSLAVAGVEASGAALHGVTLRETWRRAFGLFRDRPLVVAQRPAGGPFVPEMTYGEAWERSQSLARGLAFHLERSPRASRVLFLLATRNRPEWIFADIAAIERGYIVAPVSPEEPEGRLRAVLERCRPAVVLIEARDEERLAPLLRACPSIELRIVCDDPSSPPAVGRVPIEALYACTAEVPEPVTYPEDALYSLLFTSGSTGLPKGAMRSYASFHAMIASYGVPQPAWHLSFQSLTHLSERMYLPAVLTHGGTVAFSRGGAFVMEELRALAPTELGAVPRLFDLLHAQHQRRLREGWSEPAADEEARRAFGERLQLISVGSAPVRPETLSFLRKIFPHIWVTEGYGTTEVGGIAGNGQVSSLVRVKLTPIPGHEEGSGGAPRGEKQGSEGPLRGEICVRSPHTISGYFGDPEASAAALDDEGFFRTGDLGERLPDGTIRVIGRLKNAVKLAQGEFVSVEDIEGVLASNPVVDWLSLHAAPGDEAVSALVVPAGPELARLLGVPDAPLASLLRHPEATARVLEALHRGAAGLLAAHELPRRLALDAEAPGVENGRLTASGKIARPAMAARLASLLELPAAPSRGLSAASSRGLSAASSRGLSAAPGFLEPPTAHGSPTTLSEHLTADTSSALAEHPTAVTSSTLAEHPTAVTSSTLAGRLAAVASSVLGRAVSPSEPLGAALDSLGAAALLEALSEALGRTIPLHDWFAADSLAALAARLEGGAGLPEPSLRTAAQRELQRPLSLAPVKARTARSISRVLLTGATGFLGVHLLESLLMRSPWEVLCLVRASDREEGEARLRGACLRHGIKAPWMRRVRVVPGDLSAAGLGLSPGAEEVEVAVDAVVHAGAEVSWLAPYEKLRGANVDGTRAVLELASRCGARVHLVSTISAAPADREEDGSLTLEQAAASSPYVLSKWLSEQLARSALARGLPLDISRPGMIAPHSKRASGNAGDFLHRYLLGCLALGLFLDLPGQRLDFTPVDFVADAIVALLQEPLQAGATHHLVNVDQSPTYRQLGQTVQRAGAPVTPASCEQFRAALLGDAGKRAPELRALGAFFPEGGAPGMGPWPSHRSQARLAALGVRCPAIDEAYLRRWLRAVAREQGGGAKRAPG